MYCQWDGYTPPKFFCAFSDMLINSANAIVNTLIPITRYGNISDKTEKGPGQTHTLDSPPHIDFHVDDFITVVQGEPEFKRQVFDGTTR